MAQPTQAQADFVQKALADVEVAYQQTVRARSAIDKLKAAGQLTCQDAQNYNLQASAVWAYQASVVSTLRALGAANVPRIADPVYLTWKGIPGDRAAEIDCSAPGMAGAMSRLLGRPSRLGATAIPPGAVEWRVGPSQADREVVASAVAKATSRGGGGLAGVGLGLPQLVAAAIWVVIVGVSVLILREFILSVSEALNDVASKREATRQMAIQATQNTEIMERRAACYDDCAGRGRDPAACARSCAVAYPSFKPTVSSAGGLLSKALGVAVIGGLAYVGYRFVSGGGLDHLWSGGGSDAAPRGTGHGRLPVGHRLDEDAIDAEAA